MNQWLIAFSIIIIGLFAVFFFIMLIDAVKLRRLRKKYDEKNDKSKQGEQRRNFKDRESGTKRFAQPKEQGVLPTTTPSPVGKDSKSPRGFFRKRRRR